MTDCPDPSRDAPPVCDDCDAPLNHGEAKAFTVCDRCWNRTYRKLLPSATTGPCACGHAATPEGFEQHVRDLYVSVDHGAAASVEPDCPHCKNSAKVDKFWCCERCGYHWAP